MRKILLTLIACAMAAVQMAAQTTTLWTGEATGTTPWTKEVSIRIEAEVFQNAKAGDKLQFTVSACTGDDVTTWAGIDIYQCDPWEWKYWVGVSGVGVYTLELTEEHIATLSASGCELDLEHLTLTQVDYVTGTATDIISEPVVSTADTAAIFTLEGRRVATPTRGLNIIAGRKVVIR